VASAAVVHEVAVTPLVWSVYVPDAVVFDWYTAYAVAWLTAVQLTLTVLALAGLVQAEVGVDAVGNACAWASPEFTVATWTVQLAVAQAGPDETRRPNEQVSATATGRAPRRLRGLPPSPPCAGFRVNKND
jgi:hypothetical protein